MHHQSPWGKLNDRELLELLRRQHPLPDYFGSLSGCPLLHEISWTRQKAPSIDEPFGSEDALNEAIALKYTYDGRPNYKVDFYHQSLPRFLRGHWLTFTNADCQRKTS